MAYDKPITQLADNINEFRTDHNTLAEAVGDLDNLTTTEDSDIVGAINELDSDIGDLSTLTTTDKSSVVAAINEIDSDIGTISSLSTSDKSNLVSAINEINFELHGITDGDGSNLNTDASTLVGAINELNDSLGDGILLTTTGQTIKAAINEHDTEIGNISTLTTTNKTSLVAATNEQELRLDSHSSLLDQAVKVASNVRFNQITIADSAKFTSGLEAYDALEAFDSALFYNGAYITGNLTVSDSSRFTSNLSIGGNLSVGGTFDVQGTVNFINSNQVDIGDNIIILNGDVTGMPTENAGLEVERGLSPNITMTWNETGNYWQAAYDSDANTAQIVTTGDTTIVTNAMLAGSIANAKLSNSSITVTDGSTPSSVSLGGTLTFSNVANETTVSQSGGTVTIGLPDDVDITGDLSIGGAFSVGGNFQVAGDTKVISNFITVLDSNTAAGIPSGFDYVAGLKIDRGSLPNYAFVYDDSADNWRWYDSDAPNVKYTFFTQNNVTATSPLSYSFDASGNSTIAIADATTSTKGAASFSSSDFSVAGGAVSIASGGVSNTQLAGSITNGKLVNSSITVNGTSISLGSSGSFNTDAVSEGSTNLYYTTARADSDARSAISVTGSGSYDSATGVINILGGVTSVNGNTGAVVLNTDSIGEGATNLYFTNARARSAFTYGTGIAHDGSGTISADLSEFTEITSNTTLDGTADHVIILDGGTEKRIRAENLNLGSFNNDQGWTSNAGTVTSVTVSAGTGLSGGGTITSSGTATLDLDFSELTDMTGDISGSTEFILLDSDGTTESRKAASEIKLSAFNNDLSFTSDIDGLTDGFTNSSSIGLGTGFTGAATSGSGNNVVIGKPAGSALDSGDNNVIIGYSAGILVQNDQNTLIGSQAGANFVQTFGASNNLLAVGYQAGYGVIGSAKSNQNAIAIGTTALGGTPTSEGEITSTIAIGGNAGFGSAGSYGNNAYHNVLIGSSAGYQLNSAGDANNNTFIGHAAGDASTSGSNNIVIGYNADKSSATASNEITLGDASITRFRIPGRLVDVTGNQNQPNGLVVMDGDGQINFGEDSGGITFDANTQIISPSEDRIVITAGGVEMIDMVEGATDYIDFVDTMRITAGGDLEVENDIVAFTSTSISDENLKENIEVILDALTKVESLKGVTFDWKDKEETSAGLIAQDVEKILPQAVRDKKIRDGEEFKSLNYDGVVGLLVEAVKELSARVKKLESK